jgi:hypothetical protein
MHSRPACQAFYPAPSTSATSTNSRPKLGTLLISPLRGRHPDALRGRATGAPLARTSLNPYSGKWNFEGLDDDALVGRAIYWIERIAS